MISNLFWRALRLVCLDFVWEIIYFPVWWYTQGLFNILRISLGSLREANRMLSLGLMFKNMFKPMFGQYDRTGRIISFFMRLILIVYKSVGFVLWTIFNILRLAAYLALPPLIAWGIIFNLLR